MVFAVAFDATGRSLLSASRDRTLRLWDVATGVTLRVYQGHTAALWSIVRHGDTLYTASNDQTVHRWSLATPGQWMWELSEEPQFIFDYKDAEGEIRQVQTSKGRNISLGHLSASFDSAYPRNHE